MEIDNCGGGKHLINETGPFRRTIFSAEVSSSIMDHISLKPYISLMDR